MSIIHYPLEEMGLWSSVVKGGKYMFSNPAAKSMGKAIVHPSRTLTGAGNALKGVTVGAGMGYVGWEALVNDKPVARTVGDVLLGSDTVDAVVDTTGSTVGELQGAAREVKDSVSGLNQTVGQANGVFSGITDFLKNVCGGNGTNMFGNLFANIGRGNVSGLSLVGLLAAGFMIFGRFGWLGKIGGAMLAMMLIGNNSRAVQQLATVADSQGGAVKR